MEDKISYPIKGLEDSILSPVSDIGIDIAETGIDLLISNEILQSFPIIGSFVSVGKAAVSLRDVLYVKRICTFVQNIQNKPNSEDAIKEFQREVEANPKKMSKIMEITLDYLEKQSGYFKAKIEANFFLALFSDSERISLSIYELMLDYLNLVNVHDLKQLSDLNAKGTYHENDDVERIGLSRLDRTGLISYYDGQVMTLGLNSFIARISEAGKSFCKFGLKDLNLDMTEWE